jgi:hypothetical protein
MTQPLLTHPRMLLLMMMLLLQLLALSLTMMRYRHSLLSPTSLGALFSKD